MNENKWHELLRGVELRPGDLVVDVGAHDGDTVQIWLDKGAGVYAFEPQPAVFARLQARFGDNPLVTCVNAALWDVDGAATLYLNADAQHTDGASLYGAKRNVAKSRGVGVSTVRASRFVKEIAERHGRHVAFMKINAEGAEYAIFAELERGGAIGLIDKCFATGHAGKIPGLRPAAQLPAGFSIVG